MKNFGKSKKINKKCALVTLHIWLGNFKSKKELEEYAGIEDVQLWKFYKKRQTVAEILYVLPVDHAEVLQACEEKYPELKEVNSYIVIFGCNKKQKYFEKIKTDKPCFYIGEFEIPENDTDGQYEAWD